MFKENDEMIGVLAENHQETIKKANAMAEAITKLGCDLYKDVGTLEFIGVSFSYDQKTHNDMVTESFKAISKYMFLKVNKVCREILALPSPYNHEDKS